ncbi:MAG: hypothetical protein ACOYBR_09775 [Fluviibacter sp.]
MVDCCNPCVSIDDLHCLTFTGEVVKSIMPGETYEIVVTYINLTTGAIRTQTINVLTGEVTGGAAQMAPVYAVAPVIINTALSI